MVREQNKNRKAKAGTPEYAEVKRGMIAAAIEVMAGGGFSQFRFEKLADAFGCNRATIYRYFDSKEELMTEVMLTLMHEITNDILQKAAGTQKVTRKSFCEALYGVINALRTDPRYAIVMDAQNIERFSDLTHRYFSDITTTMLEKYLTDSPAGRILKEGISVADAVHWLMHQIISYGFFGLKGGTAKQQKAYLDKMVIPVIIAD